VNVNKLRLISLATLSTLSINSTLALPIDWNGTFGVDTHLLNNVCRTNDDVPAKFDTSNTPPTRTAGTLGTQGITGDCDASFQTYIMKLNPQIIVNDGVTLKGEISSGYLRGGFLGDNATGSEDGTRSNSYFHTTPAQRSALNLNQMYMELFADTALVKIGRMSKNYGLGVVWNNGGKAWDRFFTMYDGIEGEMRIGNFSLVPAYAKISSYNNDAERARPNGTADVRETSVVAKYDNKNRDLVVSLLYGKRFSERQNSLYQGTDGTQAPSTGKTDITIIDPHVSKKWGKFQVAAEAPMITGDYGDIFNDNKNSKISAQAYILEAKYDLNPKWELGLNAGQASGDAGSTNKFEAMYLHPNYQIANLMFRYNYAAFNEGGKSVFDASIMNARYLQLYTNYKTDKWTWKGSFIMANAMETAKTGDTNSYHHEEGYKFQAQADQDANLGWELDFGFDYYWNPNVIISGYYGYWVLGDYYSFTNTPTNLSLANVHGGGFRATLEF
jgi:hypothetical protein